MNSNARLIGAGDTGYIAKCKSVSLEIFYMKQSILVSTQRRYTDHNTYAQVLVAESLACSGFFKHQG